MRQAGKWSRRGLLRAGAAGAIGLVVGIDAATGRVMAASEPSAGARLNAFVHIAPDGVITLAMPAVEMGQGVYTSQAMCLAEELDIGLDQIVAAHAMPDPAFVNPAFKKQLTGGSTTSKVWTMPLRKAGALARAMLVEAAARRWGTEASALTTDRAVIADPASGRTITYAEVARLAATLKPPAQILLKPASDFRLLGKSQRRIDTPDKVTGRTVYSIDHRLPGMKFAAIAGCPVIGGTLGQVDQTRAGAVPGLKQVVTGPNFVAAIGDNTWAAMQGLRALDVEWAAGENAGLQQDALWDGLRKAASGPAVEVRRDPGATARLSGEQIFAASYELPFLAHAAMEPMSCIVHIRDGGCDIWAGTQLIGIAQKVAAKVLGMPLSQVTVHNHILGGAFGRRFELDHIIKAIAIARQVDGPVQVMWSREEDLQQAYYRPIYRDELKARVEGGRITGWHHRVTGPSILARISPEGFRNGIDPDAVKGIVAPPYDLGDTLIEYVRHELPVPVTFWRGVGLNSTAFSMECFMDVLAHESGADPLDFRKRHLTHSPRLAKVLDALSAKAAWGQDDPAAHAGERAGRGVALLESFGSCVACMADVAVNDAGDVRVTRLVLVADVGQVINPDTVLAQLQGGAIFGVTTVLHGKITISDGRVEQSNFHDYRMLRIDETPVIEAHILSSDLEPGGIGEPGTVVVQPAVVNAVRAATGVRLSRMPIDPALVARGA